VSDTDQTNTPEHRATEATPVADDAPSRRSTRRDAAKSRSFIGRHRGWLIAGALAALVVCAALADVVVSWDRIHPGVRVGDVVVGSLAPQAARTALDEAFAHTSASSVTVTWDGKSATLKASDLGATFDATAAVDAAMAVGRDGSLFEILRDRIVATFGGVGLPAHASADATAAAAALDPIAEAVSQSAQDAAVTVDGTTIGTTPARVGKQLDRAATLAELLAAFVDGRASVPAVVVDLPPTISDAEAARAADAARELISAPVQITYESRSVDIQPETVAGWLRFEVAPIGASDASGLVPAGAPGAITPSFDATQMASAMALLTSGIGRPAKNAYFVAEKGSVRVVAGQVGLGPDTATLATDLLAACGPGGSRAATVKVVETQPALTTAAAKDMGISERISTFTTSYSTANPARTNNVHLLARAFDGKLVAPGAVFSFNGSAGQRTAAKGYQEAPAIVNGKLVPQLGGGVCQVGTTFFNTVFFSGLPIVERHNHSFYISHYPTGRDATVSWGGPDFKFKNDTKDWILIRTATTASTLTIALYGTDPGYDVQYTTGPFTDVVRHGVQEIKDPRLAAGRRVVEDAGVDGRNVVVKRVVYLGGVVVREDSFVSHYSPKIEVVRVGTKPSTTPTDTVSP
jgi:vancomycin resistance protein YoaR